MLRPAYPIRTERLVLRPLVDTDAEVLAAYQSLPEVCRYLPYEPRGAEVIAARLADPALNRSTLDKQGDVLWLEAHFVQNEWFKGEWTDELQFAILADEWRAVR